MIIDVDLYLERFGLSLHTWFATWREARLVARSVTREWPELRVQYCGYAPYQLFFKVDKPLDPEDKDRLCSACAEFTLAFRDSNPKVFFVEYRPQ